MEMLLGIIFIFGLFIGSFLHVLADRLPRDEDVIWGHSHCEYCNHRLFPIDLVPVFSFLFQKGKCRYCHKKLSWYYPFGECLTALLFVLTFVQLYPNGYIFLLFGFFIVSCFIVIFSADLQYGIIPDAVVYPATIISALFVIFLYGVHVFPFFYAACGATIFFLFLFLGTKGKGMGFGDVKLTFLLGLVLGFPGIIYALYIAFLTGAIVSFILILWKRKHLKSTIPFGPFLVLGTLIVFLFPGFITMVVKMVLPL